MVFPGRLGTFHIAMSEGEELLAYGRLSPLDFGVFKISQLVVPKQHQRQGYASKLLQKLMELSASKGAHTLQLNSQVSVTALYQRLGFREVGEPYQSNLTGVEHIKMQFGLRTKPVPLVE